ncbi:M24 family metallopeptidase [Ammoniphilus sp. YIM 78166]|uniref:M24 family metallopeptidase n=1 Tax=Ammoniphilus sp. YIM 78166 TaxID=1644106 RepID=UPI0010703128|nr:M24 family metallopeptidase [Ammoniphilus sp. YIM 78166]
MALFEVAEYRKRMNQTKQRMAEQGIDVLLVTDPANMNYLSGYDGWSFYVHQLLIVRLDEEQPTWVGRGMDATAAVATAWIDSDHIVAYPDDYVHNTVKHPMDYVAQLLDSRGQGNKTIAVEMDAYYFTAQCYESLKQGLQNAQFKNGTNLVNWVRIVKSDQEIVYMKRAAKIVENAMRIGIESIEEGIRECDVVAKIYHAQISGTESYGGDYPAIVPLLPSGEKTNTPHLTWTDQKYRKGDPVILELAGCHQRYHSPLARTVVIGEPEQKIKDLAEVVIEGIEAALAAVKPGATCEEVELAWRTSIEKSGFKKDSRIGYSTGVNYPPDWGEHTASIRPGDRTILQPNMTFHMIPGIWLDKYGVEISETFRVTETGCETLANFPRQLFIK